MKISIGKKRTSKKWENKELTWAEFCERAKSTVRTDETVEEYKTAPKEEQSNIKDVGGFVGGHLIDGIRKKGQVLCRSMLTLDMDYATPTIIDEIELVHDFTCCIYSTHTHTPEAPRLRLIIPLKREVTEEEYGAVARAIAQDIGIDLFDDTTYEASRLMYWASTSSDGEFVFHEIEGNTIDPDKVLARYTNWRDVSTWAVSSRQTQLLNREVKKQADPLSKEGIVGAFCRTFSPVDVISEFLSDIYAPSAVDGRYDLIEATSSAGVVIYDDKFFYSHHAKDPLGGMLLNSFDLCRLHFFSDLSDKKSFSAMHEWAMTHEAVKNEYHQASFGEMFGELPTFSDFGEFDEIGEPEKEVKIVKSLNTKENSGWLSRLSCDKHGNVTSDYGNVSLILENDKNLQSVAYNELKHSVDVRGKLPWGRYKSGWGGADDHMLLLYLNRMFGIYAPQKTQDALNGVAYERRFHPIKEYLNNLPEWDGTPRLDTLLIDYFNAEDTLYTREAIRKTLVAAVTRVFKAGVKFDYVLVLNGSQGLGKSTFFSRLGGKWFSDSLTLPDMKDKTGAEKLQEYWILELGELAGMRKADLEAVKSFITREDDKYRASYGVRVESHPRQCIIVGTTNAEEGFLRDVTGNRRFLPVVISEGSEKKAWDMDKEEIDQIWAEALILYKKGETLVLSEEAEVSAETERTDALETDEREGLVRKYLDTPLPENWKGMDIYNRRLYLHPYSTGYPREVVTQKEEEEVVTVPRDTVCNLEIWCECFCKDGGDLTKFNSLEIAGIMKKIGGWERYKHHRNRPPYGKQRGYQRKQ